MQQPPQQYPPPVMPQPVTAQQFQQLTPEQQQQMQQQYAQQQAQLQAQQLQLQQQQAALQQQQLQLQAQAAAHAQAQAAAQAAAAQAAQQAQSQQPNSQNVPPQAAAQAPAQPQGQGQAQMTPQQVHDAQRIQLLRHYATYFPEVLFVDEREARAFTATVPRPSAEVLEDTDPSKRADDPDHHAYILHQIVGRNQGTAAFVATRLSDKLKVIAKIILLNDEKQTAYAHSEVQCLAVCGHFGIVKHFDDFEREDKVLLIMEYGSGGDLNKQIKQRTKESLPFKEHEVGLLFYQIVLALDHVHRHRMIHRDLKSANIFLMPTGVIKLGDFGFSKQYTDTVSMEVGTSFCGTPYYLPPEIWERKRYSKKADMWSLGVILYELLTLQRPFKGPSQREIMQQVLYLTYDPFPCPVSEEMQRFVRQLLSRDPETRPSTRQLLQTEFLKYVATIFEEIVSSSDVIQPADKQEILTSLRESRSRQNQTSSQSTSMAAANPDAHFEGYLLKLSSDRRWKKRYFTLRNRSLRISLSDKPEEDSVQPQSVSLDLINDVLPVPGAYSRNHPNQLVIWFSNGKKIVARADTPADRDQWINILHQALGMN